MSRLMLNRLLTYLQAKILRLKLKGYKLRFNHDYIIYHHKPVTIHVIVVTPSGWVLENSWTGDTFQTKDMFDTFRKYLNHVERKYG